ncbi:hypothetical protein EDD18DRAFT_1102734 [Armillaria luteobubalina]|uniref:Uncharacterized protein n=1 Tax=Armillaria luteobubalina TaxID=153913 RepID=A0AA39QAM2_9AGAR|nr:hypothetical protein EDD18DRAFT_1102734 [Armillaria luteobubalina]
MPNFPLFYDSDLTQSLLFNNDLKCENLTSNSTRNMSTLFRQAFAPSQILRISRKYSFQEYPPRIDLRFSQAGMPTHSGGYMNCEMIDCAFRALQETCGWHHGCQQRPYEGAKHEGEKKKHRGCWILAKNGGEKEKYLNIKVFELETGHRKWGGYTASVQNSQTNGLSNQNSAVTQPISGAVVPIGRKDAQTLLELLFSVLTGYLS